MRPLTLDIHNDSASAGMIRIEPDVGSEGLDAAFFDITSQTSTEVHQLVLMKEEVKQLVAYLSSLLA